MLKKKKKTVEIDVAGRHPTADVSSASEGASLDVRVDRKEEEFSVVSINNSRNTIKM